MKAVSVVGQKFGRLLVLEEFSHRHHPDKPPIRKLRCRCECGTETTPSKQSVTAGVTLSCGCLAREINSARTKKHGMYGTPEYLAWHSMIQRCENPKSPKWPRYGGRGITVCDEWHDFANFFANMGARPEGGTLDRIDNEKGYSPDNCRWTTRTVQQNNTSRNRLVTFRGETKTISEWSKTLCIHYKTLTNRLDRGWSIDEAMTAMVDRSIQRR